MVAKLLIDELMANAIMGALDERQQRLAENFVRLNEQPSSASRDEALDITRSALRHGALARLAVTKAVEEAVDYPDEATFETWFQRELHEVYDASTRWHEFLDR